jgi:hypothetical protein
MRGVALVADVLRRLYGDEWSLRRVLATAKVDASRVPFDHRAVNMAWFAAEEAARQGRLLALVEVIAEEYGTDEWVAGLVVMAGKERKDL